MVTQRLAKGISSVVGLGQEAYQHNKNKKAAAASAKSSVASQQESEVQSQAPPSYNDIVDQGKGAQDILTSEDEHDEDLWIEDDAQNEINPPNEAKRKATNAEQWVKAFIQRRPAPLVQALPLPAPVVIPQRRPGTKTRGFVRAYAPPLAASGIDQEAWLEILDGFVEQMQGQGYFNLVNLAVAMSVISYTAACGPSLIVHLSALAVHTSIEAGRRMYDTKKTNSYLDQLNALYFQPRGLYALVMKYDPNKKDSSEVLDFTSLSTNAVAKHTGGDSKTKQALAGFKGSSGTTLESQLPEVCPLVFPDFDKASVEQQANAFKKATAFASDYYDRREQATFAAHNPGSKLASEQRPFAGKYADPTTFENSGILAVLTAGAVDPRRKRRERRERTRESTAQQGHLRGRRGGGDDDRRGIVGTTFQGIRAAKKGVRKVVQQGVLYLMIVNMPTEEEMEIAAQMEARMKAEQPNWFEKFQASLNG